MWSRVISAPFSTWKLPRAFSTRDALNKTCSRSSRSSDLAHPPQPLLSCSHTAKHTHVALRGLHTRACTHIYTRVYSAHTPLTQIHVLHGSILFSFPFPLLFSLGHASTPFHRSFSLSFEFLHRIGNQSLYLPFFLCSPLVVCLCFSLSFLFLVLGGCFLPRLSSLISLSTCTQARPKPLLPPSVARCRSFQLLQRQPNKCLSYSLPRRFAPLSLHSANSARVHGKTS